MMSALIGPTYASPSAPSGMRERERSPRARRPPIRARRGRAPGCPPAVRSAGALAPPTRGAVRGSNPRHTRRCRPRGSWEPTRDAVVSRTCARPLHPGAGIARPNKTCLMPPVELRGWRSVVHHRCARRCTDAESVDDPRMRERTLPGVGTIFATPDRRDHGRLDGGIDERFGSRTWSRVSRSRLLASCSISTAPSSPSR